MVTETETALVISESLPPAERLIAAEAIAKPLARLIEERNLYITIKGRRHVLVEGWVTLGALAGVFPLVDWTKPIERGWEARVIVLGPNNRCIGAAEAQCTRDEENWADRDDFAIRSMAQTRATSKAMRLPLGWIMTLAGYEATPAEEMPSEKREPQTTRPSDKQRKYLEQLWRKAREVTGSDQEVISHLATLLPHLVTAEGTIMVSNLDKKQASDLIEVLMAFIDSQTNDDADYET